MATISVEVRFSTVCHLITFIVWSWAPQDLYLFGTFYIAVITNFLVNFCVKQVYTILTNSKKSLKMFKLFYQENLNKK